MKTKIEQIQVYSNNHVNYGKLELMTSDGHWEWFCACGHNNYSAQALREIADLLDKAATGTIKLDKATSGINIDFEDIIKACKFSGQQIVSILVTTKDHTIDFNGDKISILGTQITFNDVLELEAYLSDK